MKKQIALFSILFIAFSMIFSSCQEDEVIKPEIPETLEITFLLKVSFENNWVCSDCDAGIIFLSDEEGNIIAEQSFISDTVIEFPLPAGKSSEYQNFSVSTFKKSWGNHLRLYTYQNVSPGTSWILKGSPTDFSNPLGEVNLIFQNIPNHDKYCISISDYGILGQQTLPNETLMRYYSEPENMVLVLEIENSADKYMIVEDVVNNNPINLADMQICEEKTMPLYTDYERMYYSLYGFLDSSTCNNGSYILGMRTFENSQTMINIEYPPNIFDFYRFIISETQGTEHWGQTFYGDIPDASQRIIADFHYVNTSPDDFEIQCEGTFDIINSTWFYENETYIIDWNLTGPNDKTKYALPKLSSLITERFPEVNNSEFSFSYASITDYADFASYEDLNHKYLELGTCFLKDPSNSKAKYNTTNNKSIDISEYSDYWPMP